MVELAQRDFRGQQLDAAPLDDTAVEVVRDREEVGEAQVEDVVDLLGTDLALARQAFAHRGEAGDVDERERALEAPVASLGCFLRPLDDQPRHVRLQPLGCRCGQLLPSCLAVWSGSNDPLRLG